MFLRNPTAAEILAALGGAKNMFDEMKKQSAEQQRQQESMRNGILQPNPRWLLHYIYKGNARFFDVIKITDADWSE